MARRADELLAVARLLVGNTTKIHAAVRLMGTTVSSHNVSSLLTELTRRPDCADVLHELILLADYLDQRGSPIDYARRRALFTTRSCFIDPAQWRDLQRRLRSNHLPDAAHAQRWIFHTLTGSPSPLAPPSPPLRPPNAGSTSDFAGGSCPPKPNCCWTLRGRSSTHGIDEPVQWTPQLADATVSTLHLPGPDPDRISAAELHRAVLRGDFSIARLAHTLNTTTAHAIYLLSQHPIDWSPPRFRHSQYTAARIGQWRSWYEDDHYSLPDIADLEGTSLATDRLALLKYGFPLNRRASTRPSEQESPTVGRLLMHQPLTAPDQATEVAPGPAFPAEGRGRGADTSISNSKRGQDSWGRVRVPACAFRRFACLAAGTSRSCLVQGSSRSFPVVARDSMSRWAWAAASSG